MRLSLLHRLDPMRLIMLLKNKKSSFVFAHEASTTLEGNQNHLGDTAWALISGAIVLATKISDVVLFDVEKGEEKYVLSVCTPLGGSLCPANRVWGFVLVEHL